MFDIFPILLDGGGLRRGLSSFRFENMRLNEEGFKDLMKRWWFRFILVVLLASFWLQN